MPGSVVPAVRDQGVRTIIAGNDALALAAMEALRGAGLHTGVAIIGHGGTKDAIRAVLDDILAGDVDIRPQDLGVAAIGNIAALVRKKQPPSDLIVRINGADIPVNAVPGRLITRDNARDMQERWPNLIYVPAPPTPSRSRNHDRDSASPLAISHETIDAVSLRTVRPFTMISGNFQTALSGGYL